MSLDFLGRESELARLESAWAEIDGQDAPLVVVHGEAGIGKTRLMTELARSVRAQRAKVLWGTCYEGGSAPVNGVWVEAVGPYLMELGVAAIEDSLGGDARWLAPLLPGGVLAKAERTEAPAAVAQVRLAEVLTQLLSSMPEPPVLILDDMQWANPGSLELLGHVARLATGVFIAVTFRGSGLQLGHPLARQLAEAARHRSCEYLALGSLRPEDGRELLEQAAGQPLQMGLLETLYEQSGGNPFFLGELGRYIVSHGGGSEPGHALPESIRAAIGLRVMGVSAETRHVLQLASVFTAGFSFRELRALTDLEEGQLLDCLDQALGEELLRSLDAERYDFSHALIRQTLYELSSPSRRARLHRRLAKTLERQHEAHLEQIAGELVRQYHASRTLSGAERGAIHALTAARVARAACAPTDATGFLRLGLDLLSDRDDPTRVLLLSELALAEAEAGLVADAPRTLDAAISLLELSAGQSEAIAELVYLVGEALWAAPAGALAIAPLVDRALRGLGDHRTLAWARLMLLDRVAEPVNWGPIPVLEWVSLDPEAVRIVRDQGTEADYAYTLNGWLPDFGTDLDQLIARVDGWRDPAARMQALIGIVGYLTLLVPGTYPAAERLCSEIAVLADDVGLLPHRVVAQVFRAALLGSRGELEAAAHQIRKGQAMLLDQPPVESTRALVTLVGYLTSQHTEADWPHLAAVMWDLARSPEHFSGWLTLACGAFAALAYARAEEVERAYEVLGDILPALEAGDPLSSITSNAIGLASAAVWELGAVDLAERLLPHALTMADGDPREFYMTSSELTAARLSALCGCLDQAFDYFGRARVVLERRDQRVLRAVVDYDEARTRLEYRQPGAAALMAAASARFEELGMHEWSRRLAKLAAADRELPDRLTPREAEVLRLVADRRTNKEIAAELVVSVHTVERHVQNVYRKIGASSRADASAYVARVEL